MNLDTLQAEWQDRDQKLDRILHLNHDLLRANLIAQHQREVKKMNAWDRYEFLFAAPICFFLLHFISRHYLAFEMLVSALALLIWCIVVPTFNHHLRHRIVELDFSQSVLEIQKQLTQLTTLRLRVFAWAFLTGQVLWFIPLLIVVFQGFFGVNLYSMSERFISTSILGSVLLIPLFLIVAKLLAPRLGESSRFHELTSLLAGEDLQKTRQFLDELKRFQDSI